MNIGLQVLVVSGMIIFGFLLVGFLLWLGTKRFIERSQNARGVVIKVKRVPFENRDTFSPIVRFTTHDGRALSFTHPQSSHPPEFEYGEQVNVLYDPRNPHKARVVRKISDLYFMAKIFWITGAGLLVVGFLIGAVFEAFQYSLGLL
jgi:hypothetical protein